MGKKKHTQKRARIHQHGDDPCLFFPRKPGYPYPEWQAQDTGQKISKQDLETFVDRLEVVPPAFKERMKELTPDTYVGLAERLVEEYFDKYGK